MPSGLKGLFKEGSSFAKAAGADATVFVAICAVVIAFVAAGFPVLGFCFALLTIAAYVATSVVRMRQKLQEYEMQIDQEVRRKLQDRTQKRKPPKRGGPLH